ncbi:MAG: T9SS type A sorting domain-containing protein [Bacteroidia bacterium]|nr:T9SS type A sorting domain-containing protein [Bacteroidia bacterium]
MRTIFFLLMFTSFLSLNSNAQAIAEDFTLTDCNGNSVSLYPILNQGKVVVLIYEHQCGSCVTGSKRVQNVINNYFSTNPNVQVMYLDNGGFNCSAIATWISNNGLLPGLSFMYSSDYASPYGSGMPIIAIAGGASHHLFFSSISLTTSTEAAIKTGIDQALYEISNSVPTNTIKESSYKVYPNPAINQLNIDFESAVNQDVNIQILDTKGNVVEEYLPLNVQLGSNKINLPLKDISSGIYIFKLISKDVISQQELVITK